MKSARRLLADLGAMSFQIDAQRVAASGKTQQPADLFHRVFDLLQVLQGERLDGDAEASQRFDGPAVLRRGLREDQVRV